MKKFNVYYSTRMGLCLSFGFDRGLGLLLMSGTKEECKKFINNKNNREMYPDSKTLEKQEEEANLHLIQNSINTHFQL